MKLRRSFTRWAIEETNEACKDDKRGGIVSTHRTRKEAREYLDHLVSLNFGVRTFFRLCRISAQVYR